LIFIITFLSNDWVYFVIYVIFNCIIFNTLINFIIIQSFYFYMLDQVNLIISSIIYNYLNSVKNHFIFLYINLTYIVIIILFIFFYYCIWYCIIFVSILFIIHIVSYRIIIYFLSNHFLCIIFSFIIIFYLTFFNIM
jgi:hypothetical protein